MRIVTKPIKLEIRHVLNGDVEFGMEVDGLKLYDYRTVEYTVELPAGTVRKYHSDGLFRMGSAQKQARVKLKIQ